MDSQEPCDHFLENIKPDAARAKFREKLLKRTTGVLRFRRRVRHWGLVAGLGLSYLAGAATMRLATPSLHVAPSLVEHRAATEQAITPPTAVPAPVSRPPQVEPHLPARVLEQMGELASVTERGTYFRLAGDRYEQAGDITAALRCYRLVLDGASEAELVVSPSDSYLLMTLKNARQKEKRDDNHGT